MARYGINVEHAFGRLVQGEGMDEARRGVGADTRPCIDGRPRRSRQQRHEPCLPRLAPGEHQASAVRQLDEAELPSYFKNDA
jgi:hypothetical protein